MLRVTKPGGLIIVSEPENLRNSLEVNSLTVNCPVEKLLAAVEFHMRWERGKTALGEGNVSIGGLIPGYLSALGVNDIQTYQSDQVMALYPPYSKPEQKAMIDDAHNHYCQATSIWDMETSRRYFLASGGSEQRFAELWQVIREMEEESLAAMETKRMCSGGAATQYLISGRKPD